MVSAEYRVLVGRISVTESLHVLASLFSLTQLSEAHLRACAELALTDTQALVRYAYRECKHSPQGSAVLAELACRAEQSGVSLAQWITEILIVYSWLENRQKRAPVREIIEYIACAQEGSGFQIGHSIEWYLEHYGFESAQSC